MAGIRSVKTGDILNGWKTDEEGPGAKGKGA
jgi:hypothetical protein